MDMHWPVLQHWRGEINTTLCPKCGSANIICNGSLNVPPIALQVAGWRFGWSAKRLVCLACGHVFDVVELKD